MPMQYENGLPSEELMLHGIKEVEKLLQEEIDTDNPTHARAQAAQCEVWQGNVSYQLNNARKILADLRRQYLLPKGKDYTDVDRTINLEAAVSGQQCIVNLLKDQQDAVKNRISFVQTLLKSVEQEMRSSLR